MRRRRSWARRVGVAAAVLCAPVAAVAAGVAAPQGPGWTVASVRFEPIDGGAPLQVAGVGEYRGVIEVAASGGAVSVVNDVGLEDYVRGISEVPVSWPAEAQKAQAVAARTYALHELATNRAARGKAQPAAGGVDICASESCQVYAGVAKERRPGAEAWSAAVAATAGQVLLYKGAPILAKYSSSNGGQSIAGGRPYLRAAADPDDRWSPLHQWRSELSLPALTAAVGAPAPITAAARVADTVVLGWTADDGTTGELHIAPLELRRRLNSALPPPSGLPRAVPSPFFSISADPVAGTAVLDGRGFGHGIGMSQYGALGKAMRGMKAPDILAAYYGGIRPTQLGPEQLPPSIRVGLHTGSRATVGGAKFRVVDEGGRALGLVAAGDWQVSPAGAGKVRVVPPAGQEGPPAVALDVAPDDPALGMPVEIRFTLSAPAAVRLTMQPPAGEPLVIDRGVLDAGSFDHALPPLSAPGEYVLTVQADAGVGRATTAPVGFRVDAPDPPAAGVGGRRALAAASAPATPGMGLELVALVALALAVAGTGSAIRTSKR